MNIFKENTKFILGFILGGLILGSISVYAALSYNANQIRYGNATLDQALDNLYSTATITLNDFNNFKNKYNELNLKIYSSSWNNSSNSIGTLRLNNIGDKYLYYEITSVTKIKGNGTCSFAAYNVNDGENDNNMTINTRYNVSDFATLILRSKSDGGEENQCELGIKLYNLSNN